MKYFEPTAYYESLEDGFLEVIERHTFITRFVLDR